MSRERKQRRDARRRADPNWMVLQMVERIARIEDRQLLTNEDLQRYLAELFERGLRVEVRPRADGRSCQINFRLDGFDLLNSERSLSALGDLLAGGNP
ncbi:MAG: hypothetical protein SFV23_21270 [Planctomycetaceae bacterium]|nr:hypothetical protein [Planctomycetaceae bacterium]